MKDANKRPDWLFPQGGADEEAPPGRRPRFVDYLFLGYSTATALSPSEALPLTSGVKVLMMIESSIALATLAVVAAPAVNILGSDGGRTGREGARLSSLSKHL